MNNIVVPKAPVSRPLSARSTVSRLMNQYLDATGLQPDGSEVSGHQAAMIGSGTLNSIFTKAGFMAHDLESQDGSAIDNQESQEDVILAGESTV